MEKIKKVSIIVSAIIGCVTLIGLALTGLSYLILTDHQVEDNKATIELNRTELQSSINGVRDQVDVINDNLNYFMGQFGVSPIRTAFMTKK